MPAPADAKQVFLQAVEHYAPEQWPAFLDSECAADAKLRQRVEALLKAHGQVNQLLDGNGLVATINQPQITEALGTIIGPYTLREQIGEGGMGIVYVADQERPVRRRVALKVIKPGMDTRDVIARFEAERQALALMDHTNIAKVFDGGATDSGRPYFVMELVRGIPITDYLDQANASLRERLELFVQVCQAVQHAHQKGIIHRDLKPTNVLVAQQDGVPVPKVIDFGVAKAINQRLSEHTVYTQMAQIIGTPVYMSPEQAQLNAVDVDTRSDVYSLGVLLYELLTGATPFDKETFSKVGFDEVRRMIREDVPPCPSQRVSTLAARSLPTVSQQQAADDRLRISALRGELDWIVMKALEKDRSRRYDTPAGLAADVQHYLNDEPVQACPPSAWYRFHKFTRRNRVAMTTTGLVALALVAGTVMSAWQAIRATRARHEAEVARTQQAAQRAFADRRRIEADEQRVEAERQRQQAEEARKEANANLQKACEAVDQMLTRVGEEHLQNVPQMEPVRKALLQDALKFYQGFLQQKSYDPALRLETGKAWRRVGDIQSVLGHFDEAEKAYHESSGFLEELTAEFPSEPSYLSALSDSYTNLGKMLAHELGRGQAAEEVLRQSLALREKLAAGHTGVYEHRYGMLTAQHTLATVLFQTGRVREAETAYRQALALSEELAAEFPETSKGQRGFQQGVHFFLGLLLARTNRRTEAEEAFHQGLAISQDLTSKDSNLWWRFSRACTLRELGNVLRDTDRFQEAETSYRQALALSEKLTAEFPNVSRFRGEHGTNNLELAILLSASDRPQEAERAYREALASLEKVVAESPAAPNPRVMRRAAEEGLVRLLRSAGRTQEAEEICRLQDLQLDEAIAAYRKSIELDPKNTRAYYDLGGTLHTQGKLDESIAAFRKVIALDPKYVNAYSRLGTALAARGKVDEATAVCREAVRLSELQPQTTAALQVLAAALQTLGYAQYRAGAWRESIEALEKSCELQAGRTGDASQWIVLALAHAKLAAQTDLPEKEREHHNAEARRLYEQADKQIDRGWPVRPGHVAGQAIWDFREEARALMGAKESQR